jgi:cation transport ATPase
VRWREERAVVRYDRRRTTARALSAALGRAGYQVAAAERRSAPGLAETAVAALALTVIVLLAALDVGERLAGLAGIVLAAVAIAAAAAALGRRATALLRRGVLDRDALALAAAAIAFALGVHDLAVRRAPPPGVLGALGLDLEAHPGAPGSGFAAAAAIAAAALAVRFVEGALRRRARRMLAEGGLFEAEVRAVLARLAVTEHSPADGSWEDALVRGVVTAALGCASFALVTHGCLGGGPLGGVALSATVAVLVIASPGALLAAGPAARAIAVIRARAAGILVKEPAALGDLAAADVACLEKNGTLTAEARVVRDLVWLDVPDAALLAEVAALEQLSAHPAGRAVAAYLAGLGVTPAALGPDARVMETSTGIAGRARGALVEVGAPARFGSPDHEVSADVSVVFFGRNGVAAGAFELAMPVLPGAAAAVRGLASRGVRPLLLSGDAVAASGHAARRLGIPGAGNLGPVEKALAVRDLQLRGARVLLVGDGWLDASVSRQADVTAAVAKGAPPAAVPAPIVIAEGGVERLPALIDLARALRAVIRQNTALAVVYNVTLIPAAALGYVPPAAAAALALLETTLALGNAARLLRRRVATGS